MPLGELVLNMQLAINMSTVYVAQLPSILMHIYITLFFPIM